MDCNKEEAVRAKGIAEKRMQNGDFEGARKIAQKAQRLFPELENITQLLTVCDVHCSAQNKILGSEMNWYEILQVESFADEVAIKKQYRKLALALHPDKNKFAGAEAAFKLIGQANMVLADQGKRSVFDSKCRVSMKTAGTKPKPPPNHVNQNGFVKMPYVPPQQSLSKSKATFWTSCPFCNMRYQYYCDYVDKSLCCQTCKKSFIAYDLGAVPGSNNSRRSFHQQKQGQNKGSSFKHVPEAGAKTGKPADCVGGFAKKVEKDECASKYGVRDRVGSAKVDDVKPMKSGPTGNTSKKRGRKRVEESGGSCDDSESAGVQDEVVQENGGYRSGLTDDHDIRRSSRRRQHVSYDESMGDDDDFVSPPKGSRGNKPSVVTQEEVNKMTEKSDGAVKGGNEEVVMEDCQEKIAAETDDSKSDCSAPDPEFYDCPDAEFHDFDQDKEDDCFCVGQTWACYDTADGMPRFYARVSKVFSPAFKLKITWLEPDPEDESGIRWCKEELPFACGKFTSGDSEETTDRLTFSHQVFIEKGKSRSSFVRYPRKGEVWALFKDWDINWSCDPENHRKYDFEIVEVTSNFVKDVGIRVSYMDKVKGFVSVFKETTRFGIISFVILPMELLRFSHQIPAFKLSGTEKEGVPVGSYELDPAALPVEVCVCSDVKAEAETLDVKSENTISRSPDLSEKYVKRAEKLMTPKKDAEFVGKNDTEYENFNIRRSLRDSSNKYQKQTQMNPSQCSNREGAGATDGDKDKKYVDLSSSNDSSVLCQEEGTRPMKSAGELNTPKKSVGSDQSNGMGSQVFELRRSPRDKKSSQSNASQSLSQPDPAKDLGGVNYDKQSDLRSNVESNIPTKSAIPPNSVKNPSISKSSSLSVEELEVFHDFDGDKRDWKFEIGQILALYSEEDKLPKIYGLVNKIERSSLRLHATVLEPCTMSSHYPGPISCGAFKLQTGRPRVFLRTAFSHIVEGKHSGKNKFEIYPREGEVWALYKKRAADNLCSDPKKFVCEIVEIVEVNERFVEVLPLTQLKGFKSVFKAPRSQRSRSSMMEIPRADVARFSHRIPAFKLTVERDGQLRGCWELDPASVPGYLIVVD